jgi:undecaprenyl-diphosphatase
VFATLDALDRRVSARIVAPAAADGHVRTWVRILRRFSEAGSYGIGWVVAFAVVGVTSSSWQAGLAAAVSVVAMLVLNTIVKQIIKRPRPATRAIDHAPHSYSMPSAHTSMAMVGAATMSVLVPELTLLWWAVALCLAVSRVVLGMHYLGDVLVGALFGAVLGLTVAAPLVSSL